MAILGIVKVRGRINGDKRLESRDILGKRKVMSYTSRDYLIKVNPYISIDSLLDSSYIISLVLLSIP